MAKQQTTIVEDEDDGDETPAKKSGMGVVMIIALALLAGGGAAAGAYFLAPSAAPSTTDEVSVDNDAHADAQAADDSHKPGKEKSHKKKKGGHGGGGADTGSFEGGEMQIFGDKAYFRLDPFIVSIQPIGKSRHVKISLVFETTSDHADALTEHTYHIRDILNTYLRSIDGAEFEDPATMVRMRAQILRRVRAISPNIAIENVLITEFILT